MFLPKNPLFCGLKAPNLKKSCTKVRSGNSRLIWHPLEAANINPESVPPPSPSRLRRKRLLRPNQNCAKTTIEIFICKSLVAALIKNAQLILIVADRCYKVVTLLWTIYFLRKIAKTVNCDKMARGGHFVTTLLLVHNTKMNGGLSTCAEM